MATTISPQHEELLKQAISTGRFKDQDEALAEALRLLHEQAANGSVEPPSRSTEEWVAAFRNWSRKRRPGNPHMDDSRESIYGDRGA